ncbi:pilus assembly protein [Acinetobacter chinensis]|uniref:pilus assembly protein PilY n=1 Tax=Acinetobacter chinensis TaxID=2004650 RepID=UPI0029345E45|nr:pilus assembly protein PilY [Acinetobacter chinensis]WOE41317.1 pilus assembly protein PilY [Acinetobacter chinensis]
MKKFNQKLLSATVSMLMTVGICHVATTQASDIDIYKLPDQTKLTIYMMLDTSGSMDMPYMYTQDDVNSPCDLPTGTTPIAYAADVPHPDGRGYTRNFCEVGGGAVRYYYRSNKDQSKWWSCGSAGQTESNANTGTCATTTTRPGATVLAGYYKNPARSSSNDYYYPVSSGRTPYYDRISRLKDALYELATSDDIPATTKIGVGTYSYNNNSKGYIRIMANNFGAASTASTATSQRGKLLTLINGMSGSGGTPTAQAYAEAAAALLGTTSGDKGGIGNAQDSSTETVSRTVYYKRPVDDTEPRCSGKGIYVLTDGLPSSSTNATSIMQAALTKRSESTTNYDSSNTTFTSKTGSGWSEIGKFSRSLMTGSNLTAFFSSARNNDKHQVKTAVVGFGSVFDVADPNGTIRKNIADPKTGKVRTYYNCSLLNGDDQKNTCYWGNKTKFSDGTTVQNGDTTNNAKGFGEGGFYSASSTDEVITSFKNFVEDMEPEFDPIATGSPSLPVDALNPIQIQPYGYYAQFTPQPHKNYQLWLGNLNKYHVLDGQLYDNTKLIALIRNSGTDVGEINPDAHGIWGANDTGGVLGRLPLGDQLNEKGDQYSKRKVFTNREITAGVASETSTLKKVDLESLFSADATKAVFSSDPKKNYWLNVLGYGVGENQTGVTQASLAGIPEIRQMGAVMHSKPLLLTQEGKVVVNKGTNGAKPVVTSTDRKDYLLYGTNQGMLHVVNVGKDTDDDRGKEVFTFVPHEMMENQYKGFLSEGNTNGGRQQLYYGIDGAWTSHTQYVSKTDGTLTVKDSGRKDNDKELNLKGLQWVYGGLRMGGRSYYALDLSDIENPSMKFHINPTGTGSASDPAGYMGESWSKPTVTWVNWGGTRKLVMLVGGGYDSTGDVQCGDASRNNPAAENYDAQNKYNNKGYECPKYNQTNNKGAGVYMFDAGNGDLLWWASANAGTSTGAATDSGTIKTHNDNLKFSVVSQINAVDRDSDGLADHLYFGDLGGQAFRIDLNNKAATKGAFAKRVVRLYNGHVANGASPRFYEMPSFSVHKGVDGMFGALALSSGNRSSPLAGTHTIDGSVVTTATANDGVYVIYDNDVARSDLYSTTTLRTSPDGLGVSLELVDFDDLKAGIAQTATTDKVTSYTGGWKYQYDNVAGKYKGMNEIYALDSMLYVNVYHKNGTGIMGDCGSGVVGDTELYQFCLPTGKCSFYKDTTTAVNKVILGGGILGTGLGAGYSNKTDETGLIIPRPGSLDCTADANKNKPQCQLFDTGARLQHLRWYESR